MARKSRTYPEAYLADKKSLWHMARNRIDPGFHRSVSARAISHPPYALKEFQWT